MDYSNEFTLDEFKGFMADPLFQKIEFVGINGGEPTLVKGLPLFAKEILKLPKLKGLNIISHGFNQKQIFPALEEIYAECKKRGKSFHVSISLDGYDDIHNEVRGLKVFPIVKKTILEIRDNTHKYCDSWDVGCTVVRQNVDHLIELDSFAIKENINIKYRLGIENKRIESDKLKDQFNLNDSLTLQSAKEFFYGRMALSKNFESKFKFFSIWSFINNPRPKRYMGCHWKDRGVTMDSRGDLYYCAVASEKIGSLREKSGEDIFYDPKNLEHRKEILEDKCDSCTHDYYGIPETKNVLDFFKYLIFERFFWITYYLKSRVL